MASATMLPRGSTRCAAIWLVDRASSRLTEILAQLYLRDADASGTMHLVRDLRRGIGHGRCRHHVAIR